MKRRSHKRQNIITLLLTVAIIVVVNVLSSFIFTRIDLTGDKRFTLSEPTKKILANLPDLVFFKVYLEGDFPPDFRRLRDETKLLLDEMRIYAKGNIEYEFIDPTAIDDKTVRENLYRQLSQKGLFPTTIEQQDEGESSQQIIFPGAIVTFNTMEQSLSLLNDQLQADQETMINNSIRGLEYQVISQIKKMTAKLPPQICFIAGQGELDAGHTADIAQTLGNYCSVNRISLDGKLDALKYYSIAIIAKPDSAFNERDKFILDQFIMRGGRVLWLIDQMNITMDSLAASGQTIAMANQLNLDDMLFRYGVRINYDLLADLQSVPIPIKTGNYTGSQPEIKRLPWYFFPLLFPTSTHPIVNNLNAIKTEFISSLDTIGVRDVTKTILLTTSQYTRQIAAPVRVSLDIIRSKPDPREFNKPYQPVAVLLEGTFTSNFKNRVPSAIALDTNIGFKEASKPTKMIVMSDGDVIRNEYRKATGKATPLGYDRYNNQFFGNKNLIQNMIDYLSDDSNLLTLRSKEVKLRLLDKNAVKENLAFIQGANIGLPVILIMLVGLLKMFIRKRKYA